MPVEAFAMKSEFAAQGEKINAMKEDIADLKEKISDIDERLADTREAVARIEIKLSEHTRVDGYVLSPKHLFILVVGLIVIIMVMLGIPIDKIFL